MWTTVLILLRVWVLNDRKRSVVKWTGLFYLIIQMASVGYAIAVMVTATGTDVQLASIKHTHQVWFMQNISIFFRLQMTGSTEQTHAFVP